MTVGAGGVLTTIYTKFVLNLKNQTATSYV